MDVHETTWMSNHAHICITDVRGILPKFMCQMNSLISRQINALAGESGTNIEKGYSSIEIADDASMLRLSAYTLANPCAANLVNKASDWTGFCTYQHEYNKPFNVERPKCGIWRESSRATLDEDAMMDEKSETARLAESRKRRRKPSKLPDSVEAVLARPSIMPELTDEELRQKIRVQLAYNEKNAVIKRKKENKTVLRSHGALSQKTNHQTLTPRKPFTRRPLVAAESEETRRNRIERIFQFRQKYKEALERYHAVGKEHALFPRGTWKMRTLFKVTCSPCLD